jgi:phospholipase C
VSALSGIVCGKNTNSFGSFVFDVQGPYPYAYTFIEPNYGDVTGGSYVGGSSQHPNDSTERGETLIKANYEAIRNSLLWERSLLIITYDEHGGFYDSVPPGPAVPPGDGSPQNAAYNSGGFMFDRYGVRVPAVIVSPRIAQGAVDPTLYDHASVAATFEALFGFKPMTQRDAQANNVLHLLSPTTLRTNCPTTLHNPVAGTVAPAAAEVDAAVRAAQPLPAAGNVHGVMAILAKTDAELAGGNPAQVGAIRQRVAGINTVGQAEAYAQEVMAKAQQERGPPPPPAPPRIPEPAPALLATDSRA